MRGAGGLGMARPRVQYTNYVSDAADCHPTTLLPAHLINSTKSASAICFFGVQSTQTP